MCRTRSAATIYGPLTVAQVLNCFLWAVYGLAVGDVWVTGPNGTGLLLGLVQAALLIIFPSAPAMAVVPEEGKAILSDFAEVGAAGSSAKLPLVQLPTLHHRFPPDHEGAPKQT